MYDDIDDEIDIFIESEWMNEWWQHMLGVIEDDQKKSISVDAVL